MQVKHENFCEKFKITAKSTATELLNIGTCSRAICVQHASFPTIPMTGSLENDISVIFIIFSFENEKCFRMTENRKRKTHLCLAKVSYSIKEYPHDPSPQMI